MFVLNYGQYIYHYYYSFVEARGASGHVIHTLVFLFDHDMHKLLVYAAY